MSTMSNHRGMHLAQLNISRMRYPTRDPRMAEFMNNRAVLDRAAERSEGFVWVHQSFVRSEDRSDDGATVNPFADPTLAINLSVWESVETLHRYVWQTVHKQFHRRRGEWFEKLDGPQFVMWWVPAGHLPTLAEAKQRLDHLAAHGPSAYAFGWASVPSSELWNTARRVPDGKAA
jgi:hypothetical protein